MMGGVSWPASPSQSWIWVSRLIVPDPRCTGRSNHAARADSNHPLLDRPQGAPPPPGSQHTRRQGYVMPYLRLNNMATLITLQNTELSALEQVLPMVLEGALYTSFFGLLFLT